MLNMRLKSDAPFVRAVADRVPVLQRRHLNLVRQFSVNWFKLRDQRSVLGLLWSFLNPLIMTAILFFLFKTRLNFDHDRTYFIYILIGSVAWNFFAGSVEGSTGILIRKAFMIRNVVFPKEIMVFSQVGVFIIQHAWELCVVFIFLIFMKIGISCHLVLLPLVILIEGMLIAGITLFLSSLCVYARDMEHIWSVFARMTFFITPVFYKTSSLSPQFRWVVILNPMTQIIDFYRAILLEHRWPALPAFLAMSFLSGIVLIAGYLFFKHQEPIIVEKV